MAGLPNPEYSHMDVALLGKLLMLVGALLFVGGLLAVAGARLGLGQLPGDLSFKRGSVSFFVPVATSLLLSVGLTVVLNIVLRFFK